MVYRKRSKHLGLEHKRQKIASPGACIWAVGLPPRARTAPQEILGFVLTVAAGAIEKAGGLVASAAWSSLG